VIEDIEEIRYINFVKLIKIFASPQLVCPNVMCVFFGTFVICSITRFTSKKTASGGLDVFAILLSWPDPGSFRLGAPNPSISTTVSLLGVCNSWCHGAFLTLSMDKCIIIYYQLVKSIDFMNIYLSKIHTFLKTLNG